MPYRIDPDRDRQRRADLLERHGANRRQAAALTDELTTLGARSRALREQLAAIRGEHDAIERELAALSGEALPDPPAAKKHDGPDAAHEARSGALFFGLAVAGAAAVVTAVALIGTRTIASAALADGWGRWGVLAMRAEPAAAPEPPSEPPTPDHVAMRRVFGWSDAGHGRHRWRRGCAWPVVVDEEGDVRVIDRGAIEEVLTAGSPWQQGSWLDVSHGDLKIRAGVGSLLHDLGFRTGDRLESINGFDLRDPQRALEAYETLRDDPLVSVRIRRDGQPKQLLFAFTRI